MNNKGQSFQVGAVFLIIFLIIAITLFGLIDPLKETLDNARNYTLNGEVIGLNCPGVEGHNADDYANDTTSERLIRRPTCFVTGISMVWFVSAVLLTGSAWVVMNWRKSK